MQLSLWTMAQLSSPESSASHLKSLMSVGGMEDIALPVDTAKQQGQQDQQDYYIDHHAHLDGLRFHHLNNTIASRLGIHLLGIVQHIWCYRQSNTRVFSLVSDRRGAL